MPNGTSSSAVPEEGIPRSRLVDLMVVLGVLISLGLIVISAMVNFRMAFRSADTELDAWIYGIGAALVDCLKAITPFMVWWGWRGREYLAVIVGIAVFVLCSWFSFTNGIGFAADQRSFKEGSRSGAIERHGDDRRDLERLEKRLGEFGPTRSTAELQGAIDAALAAPIGRSETVRSASDNCTLNRRETRQACVAIGDLRVELGRAEEKEQVRSDFEKVRGRLQQSDGAPPPKVADPQVDVLDRLFSLLVAGGSKDNVRLGLVVVVGLVFEVASGLGLYLVTTPWRVGSILRPISLPARGAKAPAAASANAGTEVTELTEPSVTQIVVDAVRIGDVAQFMSEGLEVEEQASMASSAVFAGYAAWCRAAGEAPLRESEFQAAFAEIAEEVGIPVVRRGSSVSYVGIRLMVPGPTEALASATS